MNDIETILLKTNGGLIVFQHFFCINNVKRHFCNKYRKDNTPSCKLQFRNGRYYLRDYGSSVWNGDCFAVTAKILSKDLKKDFLEIISTINNLMNIIDIEKPDYSTEKQQQQSIPYDFTAVCINYTNSDIKYWGKYGILQTILKKYNVVCVTRAKLWKPNISEKKIFIYSNYNNPTYGYMFNSGTGIKIYRPFSKIRFMYAGKLPKPYIFGYEQLPPTGNTIFITGGEKDVLCLAAHNFNAVCFNSETASIPSVINELSERFDNIVILYDTDATGINESKFRLTELKNMNITNAYRLVLPLSGEKSNKDISDFFANNHTSAELQLLTKNIITK